MSFYSMIILSSSSNPVTLLTILSYIACKYVTDGTGSLSTYQSCLVVTPNLNNLTYVLAAAITCNT
jgi:hypothetical protein